MFFTTAYSDDRAAGKLFRFLGVPKIPSSHSLITFSARTVSQTKVSALALHPVRAASADDDIFCERASVISLSHLFRKCIACLANGAMASSDISKMCCCSLSSTQRLEFAFPMLTKAGQTEVRLKISNACDAAVLNSPTEVAT